VREAWSEELGVFSLEAVSADKRGAGGLLLFPVFRALWIRTSNGWRKGTTMNWAPIPSSPMV
jgi:hypothetical protein